MKVGGKQTEYAIQIIAHLSKMFEQDCENPIDLQELQEGDNLTHFIHALANLVPTHFYNKIANENENSLSFNHLANHLVFQYSKRESED